MAELKHRYTGVEYIEVAKNVTVKYKEYFDLGRLYMLMHEWLVQEGYATRKDSDFGEIFYLHREKQKGGDEVQFMWRLKKSIPPKSYFRYDLDIDAKVILLQSVEIIHDNKKFKTNTGEIEIQLSAKLILDASGAWKSHPVLKHFNTLFWKRLRKAEIEKFKKGLYWDVFRLQEAIKTYLQQSTYLPEMEFGKFEPLADLSG